MRLSGFPKDDYGSDNHKEIGDHTHKVQDEEIENVIASIEKEENTVFLDEIKIEIPTRFNDKVSDIKKAVPKEYQGVFTIEQIGAGSGNESDF